jgi:hypothetical protein
LFYGRLARLGIWSSSQLSEVRLVGCVHVDTHLLRQCSFQTLKLFPRKTNQTYDPASRSTIIVEVWLRCCSVVKALMQLRLMMWTTWTITLLNSLNTHLSHNSRPETATRWLLVKPYRGIFHLARLVQKYKLRASHVGRSTGDAFTNPVGAFQWIVANSISGPGHQKIHRVYSGP